MLSALAGGQLGMLAEARGGSGLMSVVWDTLSGWEASGQTITKTAADAWENNRADSVQRVDSGDCLVGWKPNTPALTTIIGLTDNASSSYLSFRHGWYASPGGQLYTMESGSYILRGSYTTDDTLEVNYAGGAVTYLKNGALVYTSLSAPAYPARVGAVAYYRGSSGTIVGIGGNWA